VVKLESVFVVYYEELQQHDAVTTSHLDACRLEPSRVWSHIGAVLVNLGDERVAFVPKGYRVSNVFSSPLLF
jgi:hypothetical protein